MGGRRGLRGAGERVDRESRTVSTEPSVLGLGTHLPPMILPTSPLAWGLSWSRMGPLGPVRS